tara:strand:- start:933 stop:1940 length:1008 start_codon:yes stop_codon:yes gene_type:complete
MNYFDENDKIYVAGSKGMVGSAICRLLIKKGYQLNKELITSSRKELDLRDKMKVDEWFVQHRPNFVIIAAAKVGGILANKTMPVEFLLDNLKIQNNLIEASYKFGVKRLLFLGSSCIYPKYSKQPIKEKYLLTDSLETSNEYYALAKIAGLKLCEAYRKQYNFDAITLMPTNLYGPGDNYDLRNSHVMPAMIRKFYEAKKNNRKEVLCWGTGNPLREFLFVDDLAEACLFAIKNWFPDDNNAPLDDYGKPLFWLNVGCQYEISIRDLAKKISKIVKFQGDIIWDKNMPDGTPRKKLDTTQINNMGWVASTNLDEGIKKTIKEYEIKENLNLANNI